MEKQQLKSLIQAAEAELETISKLNVSTEALTKLYHATNKDEDLQNDVILAGFVKEVTKRGGFAGKNIAGAVTASKNALAYVNEAYAKLK
ncbi:hypothetical protein ACWOAN_04010 [Lactococcus taiwanensis]|uniref:hypothetical protein n=1 Tax=Lactococcus taiwanensis TaxID=1151742 RepID=UPI0007B19A6B|nr:hypothetical protein [Lactococcus taiwanensis]KZK37023.1 hypothetical protein P7266_1667 [Lactococcus cremoris]